MIDHDILGAGGAESSRVCIAAKMPNCGEATAQVIYL
jgi:hypothetical protein